MIEALLLLVVALFLIFAIWAWRKHVLKQRGWEQMGFPDFMRKERARRTEKG